MQIEKETVKTLIRLLLEEQSDHGLPCLPSSICRKIEDNYSTCKTMSDYGKRVDGNLGLVLKKIKRIS